MNNKIDLTKMNDELTSLLWVKERVDKLVDASMRLQKLQYERTKNSFHAAKYGWMWSIVHPDIERLNEDFEETMVAYEEAKRDLVDVIDFSSL